MRDARRLVAGSSPLGPTTQSYANRDTALAAATVLTGFGQGGGDPLRCPGAAVAIPAVGRAIDAIRPRRGIGAVLGDKPGAGGFEDGWLLAGIAGNGHRVTTSHLRSRYCRMYSRI